MFNWKDHFERIGIDWDKIEADERYSSDDRVLYLDLLMRYIDGELNEEDNADDLIMIAEDFMTEPHMPGICIPDVALIMAYIDETVYKLQKEYEL